ncbi:calcium-binding protein [Thiomonas delicata]|nr:calcium-binding protein [Thiomonas delicata]
MKFPTTGPVDISCQAHDLAYRSAKNPYDILIADAKLIKDIIDDQTGGQLTPKEFSDAELIKSAFIYKLGLYDVPKVALEKVLDLIGSYPELFIASPFIAVISKALGATPDMMVKTIRYVDPLVLDLDGDGLEITPLSAGVLFDANGDAIKTGTAWVGADDGMLAWDRNGNGSIDGGAELFGDETVLASGQKAADGFAALAELDRGSVVDGQLIGAGDGVFDARDAQYANLRVWRDLNQDGISQAGELKTLAESGVQSIQLGSTAVNTSYGDAQLVQKGSYTRADGSAAQAGSFNLAQNTFVREFVPMAVSVEAQALPSFQGSGWVRDLREAATLSPALITLFKQAQDAATRAEFRGAVDALLREWGNDSVYESASRQALAAGYGLVLSEPLDDQERGWMDVAIKASESARQAFRAALGTDDLAKFDAMRERMVGGLEKLYAYEAFTGYTFLNWSRVQGDAFAYSVRAAVQTRGVPVVAWVPLSQILYENQNAFVTSQPGYLRVNIPTPAGGLPPIETLWNRLVDDATSNLLPSLRLSKYLDMLDLNVSESGANFDFSRLNAAIASLRTQDSYEGAALFLDLNRLYGESFNRMGWDGIAQLHETMRLGALDANVRAAFAATGASYFAGGDTTGGNAADWYAGDAGHNTFDAGSGDDVVDGHDGNDILNAAGGNDLLDGGAGDDTLNAGDGDDVVYGGAGADKIDGGNGNDLLDGGEGNDTLADAAGFNTLRGGAGDDALSGHGSFEGGAGNDTLSAAGLYWDNSGDTYLFNPGDGQDTIVEWGTNNAYYHANLGAKDVLKFGAGIDPGAVSLGRSGNDMVFKAGGADQVTVKDWFVTSERYIEEVRFADGTAWDLAKLQTLVPQLYNGSVGGDVLTLTNGANVFNSLSGEDTLTGGAGNELFVGGAGNDTLTTGNGADVIVFNRGDGMDNVNGGTGTDNTVSLGGGIRYADLTLSKSSNDLVFGLGGAEQITFKNWYVTTANNKSVAKLQLVLEATTDFDAASTDPLRNKKVEQFDFAGLAAQFDQARAADATLTTWALASALTSYHLGSSDTAALGGDLAYHYGVRGGLAGMNAQAAEEVVGNVQFGTASQTLRPFAGISGGAVTLS